MLTTSRHHITTPAHKKAASEADEAVFTSKISKNKNLKAILSGQDDPKHARAQAPLGIRFRLYLVLYLSLAELIESLT